MRSMATIVDVLQSLTGRTPFLYPALRNSERRTSVALANRPVLLPSFFTGNDMQSQCLLCYSFSIVVSFFRQVWIFFLLVYSSSWSYLKKVTAFCHVAILPQDYKDKAQDKNMEQYM